MFRRKFISKDDEKILVEAISRFELETSGEMRIHIENKKVGDPYQRAVVVFEKLSMQNTRDRNGVLVYVNPRYKKISIVGDSGIHKFVSDTFWEVQIQSIIEFFKQKKYLEGLLEGIQEIGQVLKKYFPYKSDDTDELPNSISR